MANDHIAFAVKPPVPHCGRLRYEAGLPADLKVNQQADFDFSQKPPHEWLKWSFNFISVRRQWLPDVEEDFSFMADGLQASLASFALRALAKGQVQRTGENKYRITITDCYVFAHDEFAFEDDDYFSDWFCAENKWEFNSVGYWVYILSNTVNETESSVCCHNFRDFRGRTGYGGSFTVVSGLHKVENYQGVIYDYPL
jgi:hypothetical protein